MSRSRHTRPRQILAADRVAAPRASRGVGDQRDFRRLARHLKSEGIQLSSTVVKPPQRIALPRIIVTRPPAGQVHAVTPSEIRKVLLFFGPECFYGLRSITLRSWGRGSSRPTFGRYVYPGSILLFAHAPTPWRLGGILSPRISALLEQAGARITSANGGSATIIDWASRAALRDFYLIDVLMHEIAHHMLQQYRRRTRSAGARSREHEEFADAFARRCRIAWQERAAADQEAALEADGERA